jgi:hypothetical protein
MSLIQGLRYKDYHLLAAPAPVGSIVTQAKSSTKSDARDSDSNWSFEEVETVKDFGKCMEDQDILEWWRKAMGFTD